MHISFKINKKILIIRIVELFKRLEKQPLNRKKIFLLLGIA